MFVLVDHVVEKSPVVLLQYLFKDAEHEVRCLNPHGNIKRKVPHRRTFPSTIDKMKLSVESGQRPKCVLDEVYRSSGDVSHVRSVVQIPRGPQDMYNGRRSSPSEKVGSTENPVVKLDSLWMLLERAHREQENSPQETFIRECCIHPDFIIVLANDQQLEELQHFCTYPSEFCVFSVDPSFNVFKDMILLTVTVNKNLTLAQKKTGKPTVFIGPMLLHQNSEYKTFSKFVHCLKT